MRVSLVYNPTAGDGRQPGLDALLELLRAHGHEVRYRSSNDRNLSGFLARPADLVAVAGGDGTVAAVAKLLRKRRVPMAPLPLGTANNICTALGLTRLSLREQVAGWGTAAQRRFDIGHASGPWGLRRFVESFGVGMIPGMIIASHRNGGRKRTRNAKAVRTAIEELGGCKAVELDASIDGRPCAGRFVLFEVMNIPLVGPNLNLATAADPSDRRLDVVVVREFEREKLRECLEAEEKGESWPHELTTIRGRRLELAAGRFAVHLDDEIYRPIYRPRSARRRNGAPIRLAIRDGVRVLVPAQG